MMVEELYCTITIKFRRHKCSSLKDTTQRNPFIKPFIKKGKAKAKKRKERINWVNDFWKKGSFREAKIVEDNWRLLYHNDLRNCSDQHSHHSSWHTVHPFRPARISLEWNQPQRTGSNISGWRHYHGSRTRCSPPTHSTAVRLRWRNFSWRERKGMK